MKEHTPKVDYMYSVFKTLLILSIEQISKCNRSKLNTAPKLVWSSIYRPLWHTACSWCSR